MLWQDLRYSARTLLRNPGFALAAILTLTLGIGAATAIFSVVDTILLRPLPYPEADRLVSVTTNLPFVSFTGIVSAEYLDWNQKNTVLENFAAMKRFPSPATLTTPGGAVEITATRVTPNFLRTLRVWPMLGRDFLEEDAQPGRPAGVILSYGLWQDKFASDRGVLGKSATLDGSPCRIIGVLPRSFSFPQNVRVDALTPFQVDLAESRARLGLSVWDSIGRLKPGVSISEARANFETLFAPARAADPLIYKSDFNLYLTGYRDRLSGDVRVALWILLGGVGCVLLIACANVANLLLARAAGRQREISVRSTLGASRARLVRQLLTESLLLSAIGGSGGAALAAAAVGTLRRIAPENLPRLSELTVDARVLLFTLLITVITGVAFGLAPAISGTQPAASSVRFARSGPLRLLNSVEIALSFTLLAGAGLLFQSLWRLQHKNLGFEPEHVLTTTVSRAGLDQLRDRVSGMPGTQAVAFADSLPPTGGRYLAVFSREGRPLPEPGHRGDNVTWRGVSPAYFQTLRIPLKRGRVFTDADREGVTIVNETVARVYFAGEDPIGKKIEMNPKYAPPKTIVGVVADVKNQGLDHEPMAEAYYPLPPSARQLYLIVRSIGNPRIAASVLTQLVRAADPELPASVSNMDRQIARMTARPRFNGALFGSFAAVALVLAIVGIYGVISFTIARRSQEIGIRMALGADSSRIQRLILREALIPTAAGIVAGFAGAFSASRFLSSLLYDVKPSDPATYLAVGLLLTLVAIAANWVPAYQASRVDQTTVLRAD